MATGELDPNVGQKHARQDEGADPQGTPRLLSSGTR